MDEPTIKAEVLNLIRRQSPRRQRPVVATEFKISRGQTRADLAILEREFVGVEIKSERDSLKRLLKQAYDYRSSFDRTILVLDGSHLVKYLSIELSFCDVWTFDENRNLRQFSEGVHHLVPGETLYEMLTLRERELAFRDPIFAGKSKREVFFHFFRQKYGETSLEFWKSVRRRRISKRDIEYLSRFRSSREAAEQTALDREKEWKDWLRAQQTTD